MSPILGYWWRLYHNQTKQEIAVEKVLPRLTTRYRCQHPFRCGSKNYFADFWLPDLNIVIEIDDPSHFTVEKRKKDRQRTSALSALGLTVIRFTNDEVDSDVESVYTSIRLAVYGKESPVQSPPQPPPVPPTPGTSGLLSRTRRQRASRKPSTASH